MSENKHEEIAPPVVLEARYIEDFVDGIRRQSNRAMHGLRPMEVEVQVLQKDWNGQECSTKFLSVVQGEALA
jgi:hypothetical protein